MNNFDLLNYEVDGTNCVFTFKNDNTTLGFVRLNKINEVEYIFVNPIFRNQGLSKKLLKLVKEKIEENFSTRTHKSFSFKINEVN